MSISVYQKPNKKWKADVELEGLRKTKTFDKKIDATNWGRAAERDLILNAATEAALQSKVVLTLREALQRYSDEVSIFKKTAKKERQRIEYFKEVLPNVDWPLQTYKSEFIKQWEDAVTKRSIRPLKASTVLRDYSLLSSFFNWCKLDKKWINFNPVQEIRKPKKPDNRERRVEEHELEKMLIALKYKPGTVPETKMQEVALIWLIALATGMRSGEIVNRLPRDIVLASRYVQLDDTKNGSSRRVPLDDFALHLWSLAMKIDRKGSPKVFTVSNSSRDALFRKARKQAGLENADLTFHDSRHEAASLMARRIKNALTLCKIFGWKDPKQALTYYNPTNDEILDELNQTTGLSRLLA
ncbi:MULTISPECIES: tyrosine-type recombinase/integrase [Acinetobacter]|uniref:tyrosine-type recombinase/integrase n=1 Tax=Acinetobacter TaxID=469 RepID=UPI0006609BFD|nr:MULTISPECIES: site-specific integrase [Acinetobacter]RSC23222.1 site-specific integrase [Acinetobacter sp. FDAARGOS_515]VTX85787.1 Tyrosine recombinase XerD [Acinetobacter ursingii]